MGKENGLGASLALDGYNLGSDTNSVAQILKAQKLLDFPGIDVFAMERKSGTLDGAIDWKSYINPTNAHLALKDMPRTDRVLTYFHKLTIGVPAAFLTAKQFTYGQDRANDGMLLADVQAQANRTWLDWGYSLTAVPRTDTAGANGAGVDFGDPTPAAYNFGLQAVLHVYSFSGTTCTVKLQQSSDNGAGDAFTDVTGGAFTAVTGGAPLALTLSTARDQAVERYLRVVTTGTFTSIAFAVAAAINITDMTI